MNPWLKLCRSGSWFCAHCLVSFAVWSLWLALCLLLAAQIWVAGSGELELPAPVRRSLEANLAKSGVTLEFSHASFEPSGRILMRGVKLWIKPHQMPVVTADSLYLSINPWQFLLGNTIPDEIEAHGLQWHLPAMLTRSGRDEVIFDQVALVMRRTSRGFAVDQLQAKSGGLSINLHGEVDASALPFWHEDNGGGFQNLAQKYDALIRQLVAMRQYLSWVKNPSIDVTLTPSTTQGAVAHVRLLADGFQGDGTSSFSTGAFLATTSLPIADFSAAPHRVQIEVENLTSAGDIFIPHAQAWLFPRLKTWELAHPSGHALWATQGALFQGFSIGGICGELATLEDAAKLRLKLVAEIVSSPMSIQGHLDPKSRSGDFHLVGRFSPELLEKFDRLAPKPFRQWIDFKIPPQFNLNARIAPGARFSEVSGWIQGRNVHTRETMFDRIGGWIEFDGSHFTATNAYAQSGDNFAQGNITTDLHTRHFRFILEGQLRPPAIGSWFRDWWPRFWEHFDFSEQAPVADVDVQGYWKRGREASAFVFADANLPVIQGQPLDHATTLIFLRPYFYNGLELILRKDGHSASGSFIHRRSMQDLSPLETRFNIRSDLSLPVLSRLAGPYVAAVARPFTFEHPPKLRAVGFVKSGKSSAKPRRSLDLRGEAIGDFSYHGFPLQNPRFHARLTGDDLLIEPLDLDCAEGHVSGKIRIDLKPRPHRLGFDLALNHASLGKMVGILSEFNASRDDRPKEKIDDYVKHSAHIRLDVSLSAEGLAGQLPSFSGNGNAKISGQGLGEIRLLGMLSDLLNFTSLRFNDLRTNFTLADNKLQFSQISLTGENAAIDAHGVYAFDERGLDFRARVFPFKESNSILKSVVGKVLLPISNVLEVKLTGPLEHPSWAFVIGPTNILRTITQPADSPPENPQSKEARKGDTKAPSL